MVLDLKLRKIGNSVGVVLPKEALTHLKVAEGDTLTLTETSDGLRLTPASREFERSMATFASLNRRYRNALKELAK
jgi:putative addiction module antidote